MWILEYRIRRMLLHGILGACMAGIPLALLLLYQSSSNQVFRQRLAYFEKCEEQGLYLYVWTLKEGISAGDRIAEANLEKKKVWVSEEDFPYLEINVHKITGSRAKKELEKGTVLQTVLLEPVKNKKAAKK